MNTRFKFLAAALGLVIATGAVGDASAKIVTASKTVTQTKSIKPARVTSVGYRHRLHFVHRGVVKHVVIAHRLAPRITLAHKIALKPVAKATVFKSRLAGAQRSAMMHRSVTKTTVVR